MKITKRIVVWGALVAAVAMFESCPANSLLQSIQEKVNTTYNDSQDVASPIFSPSAGTYQQDTSVTIISANGATIYYTLTQGSTGTTPTTSSTKYTGPILVNGNDTTDTIEAIAVSNGVSSKVALATYSINYNSVSTLTMNPSPGPVLSTQQITITCPSPSGVTIYYTTDSSDPATSSTRQTYGGPISLVGNVATETITAIGEKTGYTNSQEILQTYTIQYQLTVDAGTGGTTNPSGSTNVTYGAQTTISATQNSGYQFKNWTVLSGNPSFGNANNASTSVTLTGNATVQANFSLLQYSLTVNAGSGGTITTPASSPTTVNYGAATNIVATPNVGYEFVNWTVILGSGVSFGNQTSSSTTVTLTGGASTIQANFQRIPGEYILTINSTYGGSTSPSGQVAVPPIIGLYETYVTATPNTGCGFTTWSVLSGSATFKSGATSASTWVVLSSDATIEAHFAAY